MSIPRDNAESEGAENQEEVDGPVEEGVTDGIVVTETTEGGAGLCSAENDVLKEAEQKSTRFFISCAEPTQNYLLDSRIHWNRENNVSTIR